MEEGARGGPHRPAAAPKNIIVIVLLKFVISSCTLGICDQGRRWPS